MNTVYGSCRHGNNFTNCGECEHERTKHLKLKLINTKPEYIEGVIKEYMDHWRARNPNYPEGEYWSGVNDGMRYLFALLIK